MHRADEIKWGENFANEQMRRWLAGETWEEIAHSFGRNPDHFRKSVIRFCTIKSDKDLLTSNVRLAKKTQALTDVQRIERKSFREHARLENALVALNQEVITLLKKYCITAPLKRYDDKPNGAVGIAQLSDLHFNELVLLPNNTYDFPMAARRLKRFATEAIRLFTAYGIKKVLVAMTGDTLNSDRRLDELLSQSTNRASAVFLGVRLLQQFIQELAAEFQVAVASVTGNESRTKDELAWSALAATDNYDCTAFNFLEYLFDGTGVRFIRGNDPNEQVVTIGGKNILLVHGIKMGTNPEAEVAKAVGRYARRGIIIHFVLFGHLHSAFLSDFFARSASLAGANAFSEGGLNLSSRASQNLIVIDRGIHGMKIDLQEPGPATYEIISALKKYAPRSADLMRPQKTILKIVI